MHRSLNIIIYSLGGWAAGETMYKWVDNRFITDLSYLGLIGIICGGIYGYNGKTLIQNICSYTALKNN